MIEFIKNEDGKNTYHFICEGCQCEGELTVSEQPGLNIPCPEDCGALYVQWENPITNEPALMCVVRPVFEEPNESTTSSLGYDTNG